MSSLQYSQPDSMVALDDSPRSLAPRSAMSMDEMMAMLSGSQFSNDTAAAGAAMSRNWRQGDANYVTATVAAAGGHRRNHE
ncbi:hypothetical protein BGZ83_011305 [Gryganskiella cystojenkinii]|nr:hypothetical protein BGZ83_011305 [Gryganskiella cystojenkinii]